MKKSLLVLVVGPSGAGKDTVLAYARQHWAACDRIVFPKRVITRPPGPGEEYISVTDAEFSARNFALSWAAHGLRYGIPKEIENDLAAGRIVIVNVSRTVIAQARERYPCMVIEITAPPGVLAKRLAARGRETETDIAARLTREAVSVEADISIINDGSPDEAGALFISNFS